MDSTSASTGAMTVGTPPKGVGLTMLDADPTQRFDLLAVVGKGGYGKVYKAYDRVTDEIVAVKIIALTDRDREDMRRIQKEIQFLSDCNHPNIVRYRGSCRQADALWIFMEYCGGGSVSDLMHATGALMPWARPALRFAC